MSVYVDEMNNCLKGKIWHFSQSCHLMADSVKELHTFANRLGLGGSWYRSQLNLALRRDDPSSWQFGPSGCQTDPSVCRITLPHYDLTAGERYIAIMLGAIEKEEVPE